MIKSLIYAVSKEGLLSGKIGVLTAARTRKGFWVMFFNGSIAVRDNFIGVVGGLFALLIFNTRILGAGLKKFRGYADYVWEKEAHGELRPGSGFPMSATLCKISKSVLDTYPAEHIEVLESGRWFASLGSFFKQPGRIIKYLLLYLLFTYRMMYDVIIFFGIGLFTAPDAQKVVLCELAVVESDMDFDEQEDALWEVRASAPNAIIEFEHYVSLLVPYDGTLDDKVYRRKPSGEIFDTHTVAPSIFNKNAIKTAQSTISEAIGLRTLIWFYRDVERAKATNDKETTRRFGPETVQRIAEAPFYPLEQWEIDALTAGDKRTDEELAELQDRLLRERGLETIADAIKTKSKTFVRVIDRSQDKLQAQQALEQKAANQEA